MVKNKRFSKKGQFDVARKTIYWMIIGVVISIVVLSFAFMIAGYRSQLTSVSPELRAELISLRFSNIPECFAYQEEVTGRSYSGIIDLDKFNQTQLFDCYHTDDEKGIKVFNFRLKLEKLGNEITTNNYFNVDDFTIYKEVLVRSSAQKIEKDVLIIYVQEKV